MDDALEPVPFEKVFQKAEKYKNAVKSYQYILDCLLKKPVITVRMLTFSLRYRDNCRRGCFARCGWTMSWSLRWRGLFDEAGTENAIWRILTT
jgi:hypothetical protein